MVKIKKDGLMDSYLSLGERILETSYRGEITCGEKLESVQYYKDKLFKLRDEIKSQVDDGADPEETINEYLDNKSLNSKEGGGNISLTKALNSDNLNCVSSTSLYLILSEMLDYDLFEKYEIGRVPEHVFVRKKEEDGYKNLDQGSIFPEVYYYLLFNSPIRTLPKEIILASILNNTGVNLLYKKQYEKALEIFDEIIEQDSDDTFFFGGKVASLYCMKEYDEVIDICDQVLDTEPELENFLILKGCAFHNLKEYEKAIETYDEALEINPSGGLTKECKEKALSKTELDSFEQMFM